MAARDPDYAIFDRIGFGPSIFFPRRSEAPPPAGAEDHQITVAPGTTLGARFYPADPGFPTILYFHGNGEIAPDHDDIAPFYHASGANLFVVDFRGYGRSTGVPNIETLVADAHPVAEAFHRILDEHSYAARRLVMGRSLGSHPALEIAARRSVGFAGLILESGAGSMRRWLARFDDPSGDIAHAVAAHDAKISDITLPVLFIHGEFDDLVPLSSAVAVHDLMTRADRRFEIIPGAGHNDLLWRGIEQYFGAVADFVAGR